MKINVKVFPNSGRQEVVKISENEFKVYLKKPAEKNKANEELIKVLKKYMKEDIKIIKGQSSRKKLIEYG